jgi:hypothetical protein
LKKVSKVKGVDEKLIQSIFKLILKDAKRIQRDNG